MIRNLRNCVKVPFRKHPSYSGNLREQLIENDWLPVFHCIHLRATYWVGIQYFLLFITGLFLTPRAVMNQRKTHCTCALSSIMAKQFDMKRFFVFFFVKKPCQTDFNINIQPLESEAAVKKDKESDLTESMGKYIFFLCLMVLWTLDTCSIWVIVTKS